MQFPTLSTVKPNPVLLKELRSRMRGPRAFIILTAFLLLLGGFSALFYQLVTSITNSSASGPVGGVIGQSLFSGLMIFELFLILFVTPALTAGALSREHEAQTFEMLVATPLRPFSIVIGKLFAALSYIFLLIIAAIPFGSIFFLFGGVTVRDLVEAILMLAGIAITFGAIGLFWSALLRKTGRATVAAYLTVAGFMLLPYFFYIAHGIIRQAEPPRVWLLASPFSALSSTLASAATVQNGPGSLLLIFGYGVRVADQMNLAEIRPTWHYTVWIYALLAVFGFLFTLYRVRPVRRGVRRRDVVVWVGALLVFVVTGFVAFDGGNAWREVFAAGEIPQPQPVQEVEVTPVAPPPQNR